MINPFDWLETKRLRDVWADPKRSVMTLMSFAETEQDGGEDLLAASKRIQDKEALEHLMRHAEDEVRHAAFFRDRAAVLVRERGGDLHQKDEEMGKAFDLSGTRSEGETNAHGFLKSTLFDDMGEVGYIAMLHIAEKKAGRLFANHQKAALQAGDKETAAIFGDILKDEKYHAAWTLTTLERWRKEGRNAEVQRALGSAKRGRFISAWRRQGLRSASGFVGILLMLCYWTVFAPFGLIARWKQTDSEDWAEEQRPMQSESQY